MANRIKAVALALLLVVAAAAQSSVDVGQAREIFGEIGGILQDLHEITGFRIKHRVPAEIITRDKVKEFLEQRMKEASSPEEIRVEELTLKKFGLVPQDFDLAKNTVDLLTEQAAAFYDFHRKCMFITDWTPSATREPALVHELGHALADQNVNLEKFIKQGQKSDDGSLARLAVMEGQASWLMAEYLARKVGQSLATSPVLLNTMAHSIESGASEFPVFESEPLYLRETLVFPYSQGLLFQNAVYERMKQKAFGEGFRRPPVSTQQILHPDTYFSGLEPARKIGVRVQDLLGGYRRPAKYLPERFLLHALVHGILKKQTLAVGKHEGLPQIQRLAIENRKLAGRGFDRMRHGIQQDRGGDERLTHLAREVLGHQPRGLSLHDGQPRQ